MMKKPYLVAYDYGSGGVWAVIFAADKAQIGVKYPLLHVIDDRPTWMSEDEYQKILATLAFDIDAEPYGWLLSIVEEQHRNQ
jgi:sugar (pentulose or hexulose) kinase